MLSDEIMKDAKQEIQTFSPEELQEKRVYLRAIIYLNLRGYDDERIGRRFRVEPEQVSIDRKRFYETVSNADSPETADKILTGVRFFKAFYKEAVGMAIPEFDEFL